MLEKSNHRAKENSERVSGYERKGAEARILGRFNQFSASLRLSVHPVFFFVAAWRSMPENPQRHGAKQPRENLLLHSFPRCDIASVQMIHDLLINAPSYFHLSPRIETALKYILQPDHGSVPVGRHELEGDKLFAMVQEYQTKTPEQTFWETHRKYIDIQLIQSGAEIMGWSPMQQMTMKKDYDPDRDIFMWEGHGSMLHLPAGQFVIFFPHDAHMGGLMVDVSAPVRKTVMKVAVE